jgi:hypothetical protein
MSDVPGADNVPTTAYEVKEMVRQAVEGALQDFRTIAKAQNIALESQSALLSSQNTTLSSQNTTLESQSALLSSQNGTI